MNLLEKLPLEDRQTMFFDILKETASKVEERHVYDSSWDEDGTYYQYYEKQLVDREVGNKGYRLTIEERFTYVNWFDENKKCSSQLDGQRLIFLVNGHEITLQNFWDFMYMETGKPTTWHPKQIRDFLFKNVDIV